MHVKCGVYCVPLLYMYIVFDDACHLRLLAHLLVVELLYLLSNL